MVVVPNILVTINYFIDLKKNTLSISLIQDNFKFIPQRLDTY